MWRWLRGVDQRSAAPKHVRNASRPAPATTLLLQTLEDRIVPTVSLFDGNNAFVRNYSGADAIQQAIDSNIQNAHIFVYNDEVYSDFTAGVAGQSIVGRDVNSTYANFAFQGDGNVPALGPAVTPHATIMASGNGTTVTLSGNNDSIDNLNIADGAGASADLVAVQISGNGVAITNSVIQQYHSGIVVDAAVSGLNIGNNVVWTSDTALDLSGAASATVIGNAITSANGVGLQQNGGGAGGLTIQGNTITSNGADASDAGIDLFDIAGPILIGGAAAGQGNTVSAQSAASAIFAGWLTPGVNITVQGNTVQGGLYGINIYNDAAGVITVGGGAAAEGNSVTGSDTGIFVRVSIGGLYVQSNVLTDMGSDGIRLSGVGLVSGYASGVGTRMSPVDVDDNNVSSTSGDNGLIFDDGIYDQYHYYDSATTHQNTISGFSTGVLIDNEGDIAVDHLTVASASTGIDIECGNGRVQSLLVSVTSGNVTASDRGVYVDGNGYGAGTNATSLSNVTISTTGADGIGVDLVNTANANLQNVTINLSTAADNTATGIDVVGSSLELDTGNSIVSGQTGLRFSNTRPATNVYYSYLNGNTLSNISFSRQTGNDIELESGALGGQEIDATAADFDGFIGAGGAVPTDLSNYYAVEDKISDALDGAGVGFVRLKEGYVFVTQLSETSSAGAIQRGVAAATNGDTIQIQAGTYTGDINIDKPLSLLGAQANIDPVPGRAGPESVIQGVGGAAPIQIASGTNNVGINGFTIQSPVGGSGSLQGGIWTDGSTGLTVEYDIIQDNTAGIAVGDSAGSIIHNLITANNRTGGGAGVRFFAAGSGGWTVSNNEFGGNDGDDILIAPTGPVSNVTITANQFVNSTGSALGAFQANNLIFTGNAITGSAFSGVNLGGGVTNSSITDNTFTDGLSRAILAENEGAGTGPNANITISGNIIDQNANVITSPGSLIDLEAGAGVTAVSGNTIAVSNLATQQITGIALNGAGTVLIQGNTIEGVADGVTGASIGIDVGTGSDATLLGNTVHGGSGAGGAGVAIGGIAVLGNDAAAGANVITRWTGAAAAGVYVTGTGAATLLENTITGSNIGVLVDGGAAMLQDNDLRNDVANGPASAGLEVADNAKVDAGQVNPANPVGGANFTGLGISRGGNLFNWAAAPAGGYAENGAQAIVDENAFTGLPNTADPVQAPNVPAQFNNFGTTTYGNIEQIVFHLYDDSGDALVDYRNAVGAAAPAVEAVNGAGSVNPYLRIFDVDPATDPSVDAVNQRSIIRAIQFQIDSPVVLGSGAVDLTRVGAANYAWYSSALPTGAVPIGITSSIDGGTGRTTVTIRFATPNTGSFNGTMTEWGSLIDGQYSLGFEGSAADLLFAASKTPAHDHTDSFTRFFGDMNGDGSVDQTDLSQFRGAFNSSAGDPNYLAYLDFDNSGTVDQIDLGQFRARFTSSVYPPMGPVVTTPPTVAAVQIGFRIRA